MEDSRVPDGASTTEGSGSSRARERWITDRPVLQAELPPDLQAALGRLLGERPVETFDEWITEVRTRTGGGMVTIADLCHSTERTAHWGEVDGETHYFRCFYDAVVLSALAREPISIRTESPGGSVIRAHATGTTDLTVVPEEAVFSFGVDGTVTPPDGPPSHADVYEAVCPYVRAFPGRQEYDQWEATVPAVTVVLPLKGAIDMAEKLVE